MGAFTGQSANLLGRTVDEVVHGKTGRPLIAAEQIPHVIADSGDPAQPLRFDPCRLVRQVKSFGQLEVRPPGPVGSTPAGLSGR